MMRLKKLWVCTLAVLLSSTGALQPAFAQVCAPLKGTITIVPEGGTTVFNPPYLTQTRLITGNVSHLGAVEGVIVQNIDTRDLTFEGTFTLTAANGDLITGAVTGQLVPTADPTVFAVVEEIVVTGGTGRFATATGNASGTGFAYTGTGLAKETFSGTICGLPLE